jgi:tetratricopeptide (TPR) repeat protein
MNYLIPIRLNNKGAELLSQGKVKEGRQMIAKALNLTKLITIENRKKFTKEDLRKEARPNVEYIWLDRIGVPVRPHTFIYRRPIRIIENADFAQCRGLAAHFTTAIVFNVSLAFHIEGQQCSRLLQKALHGYQIALDLRKHKRRRKNTLLLDMALLNNMANIYQEQSDYKEARRYFCNLAVLMKLQNKDELDSVDVDGFTDSALWRQPSCAPVA